MMTDQYLHIKDLVPISQLSGAQLDWHVAKALKFWAQAHVFFPAMTLDSTFSGIRYVQYADGREACILVPNNPFRQDPQHFNPSTDWEFCGPLMEQCWISLDRRKNAHEGHEWAARSWRGTMWYTASGSNPRECILRAILNKHLGVRAVALAQPGDTDGRVQ